MTAEIFLEDEILRYLREHKVAKTITIAKHFGCSKKTIFRKLKRTGYIRSYNKNSSGLTLPDIPVFDNNGLWNYQDFSFSRCKTLGQTICYIVETSEAGLAAKDLRMLLQDNIYHHLMACVSSQKIFRDTAHRHPIYYSMNLQRRQEQMSKQEELLKTIPMPIPRVSKNKIIDVLLVALMNHITSVKKIMPVLISEGVQITEKDVKWIFEKYEIEKKGSH